MTRKVLVFYNGEKENSLLLTLATMCIKHCIRSTFPSSVKKNTVKENIKIVKYIEKARLRKYIVVKNPLLFTKRFSLSKKYLRRFTQHYSHM